jgi:hypothetical protein
MPISWPSADGAETLARAPQLTASVLSVWQSLMRVTMVTTSIRLADVCDECLGVFELGLERSDQSVLGFD